MFPRALLPDAWVFHRPTQPLSCLRSLQSLAFHLDDAECDVLTPGGRARAARLFRSKLFFLLALDRSVSSGDPFLSASPPARSGPGPRTKRTLTSVGSLVGLSDRRAPIALISREGAEIRLQL